MDHGGSQRVISTRAILIVLVVFNVVAMGLSEVQRRALTADNKQLLMQLRQFEVQKRDDEMQALDRRNRLLTELAARVNHVEILTRTLPATDARLEAIGRKLLISDRNGN